MSFDLATIGEILNRAREEKGLSVEQVSETLYLRKSMIRAIESGEWNLLPPAVYVKGYVTDYAKHLKCMTT
jgi:cytoskeleton protein RodZ